MATRGYIKVVNLDNKANPYIGKDDILIEACHDGYQDVMLSCILEIPQKLAKLTLDGLTSEFLHSEIQRNPKDITYKELLELEAMLGTLDMTWNSCADLLMATNLFMFNRIEQGVQRYGYPVNFGYADIILKHNTKIRNHDVLEIQLIVDNDADKPLRIEQIKALLNETNQTLSRDEIKTTLDEDTMILSMSIKRQLFDILEQMVQSER